MDFTSEQKAAITTHDRNLIVTAGAGSGKTRVLVERFMCLLKRNPGWALPSVVAITFTEKAAREMRDRVRAALDGQLAHAAAAGDLGVLERWQACQAALPIARIDTIHGLCAHLLRANPAEAGLDPAFDVLDENEAAIVLDDAVELALAALVEDDVPARDVLGAYDVTIVRRVLKEYAAAGKAEAALAALAGPPEAWLARWRAEWSEAMAALMAGMRADETLWAALDWYPVSGWPAEDKLLANWHLIHAHMPALRGGDADAFIEAVAALAGGINRQGGKQGNWGGPEGKQECSATLEIIQVWAKGFTALPRPGERDSEMARWLALWRAAIDLAARTYAALKAERGALDFDDLEARARRLLLDHPAVAARYRDEFKHVLVDEFQDTNAAQRDIIYALTGVGEPGADGRLFVVGDPKQSIYAFRGADVSVFSAVRDDLLARGGQELPLSMSFRTHERLVDSFNGVFERLLQPGSGPVAAYEVGLGVPMRAHRPAEPDAVPLHDVPLTVIALRKPDKELYPDDWQSADDLRRWEAWLLAQHIHELVAAQTPVWDRDAAHDDLPPGAWVPDHARALGSGAYRPLTYGDVTLLFQAMTRAPLYEDVFKAAGLPYVTVSGRGYFNRQEVWDLLSLLQALHNPADDLALAVALRSPLFGLSDEALFALRLQRDLNGATLRLWEALYREDVAQFPAADLAARDLACHVLDELRGLAGRASIADVLARALHLTGYLATLTGLADGARRRGNVEKLLRLARESGRVSLGAFNAYAQELVAREARESEAIVAGEGAVKLMSVHASKGLEFPVVVLADASWSRHVRLDTLAIDPLAGAACTLPADDPDDDAPQGFAWEWANTLAAGRDRAERRRLLYVGATRAQDYLVVSGSLDRAQEDCWLRQCLAALDISPDALEPDDDPLVLDYEWGACSLLVPATPPPPDALLAGPERAAQGWDHPALATGEVVPGVEPLLPPLLADVEADPQAPARALTATQIAKLGRVPFYDPTERGRTAFRHAVLFDAPDPLRPLPERAADGGRLRRIVGETVHRALRAWALPDNTPDDTLLHRLETYAWEQGLSIPAQIVATTRDARCLLERFGDSDVRADLERAAQVYRELPFVFSTGQRAIHGVIDVLYFDGHKWHVLDYKTAPVSYNRVMDNARHYFLQVGVCAAAVEARTGQVPDMRLYYIHPGRTVFVKPEDWGAAVEHLEDDVRDALAVGGRAEDL